MNITQNSVASNYLSSSIKQKAVVSQMSKLNLKGVEDNLRKTNVDFDLKMKQIVEKCQNKHRKDDRSFSTKLLDRDTLY